MVTPHHLCEREKRNTIYFCIYRPRCERFPIRLMYGFLVTLLPVSSHDHSPKWMFLCCELFESLRRVVFVGWLVCCWALFRDTRTQKNVRGIRTTSHPLAEHAARLRLLLLHGHWRRGAQHIRVSHSLLHTNGNPFVITQINTKTFRFSQWARIRLSPLTSSCNARQPTVFIFFPPP